MDRMEQMELSTRRVQNIRQRINNNGDQLAGSGRRLHITLQIHDVTRLRASWKR